MLQILSTSNETSTGAELVQNGNFSEVGSDLVTNGDFSDVPLGSELITNGDFAVSGTLTSTSWSLGWRAGDNGLSISDGALNLVNDGSGFVGRAYATNGVDSYNGVIEVGKTYSLTYEVTENIDAATLYYYAGAFVSIAKDVNVHTVEFTATTDFFLLRNGSSNTTIKIDNVSLKEVINLVTNPNFTDTSADLLTQPIDLTADFVTNAGGVIVDANTFTSSGASSLDGIKAAGLLTVGKSYKLVIAGSTTSSGFTIGDLNGSGNEYDLTGFGTFYFVALSLGGLWIRQQTSGTTDLTTFTIEELGADWTVIENSGGSVSFADNQCQIISDGVNGQGIRQFVLTSGKSYKVVVDVASITGTFKIMLGAELTEVSASGIQTFYGVATATDILIYRVVGEVLDVVLNSVSVQELGEGWTVIDGDAGDTVTFGDSFAEIIKTQPTAAYIQQDYLVTLGASHKLIYTITENTFTGSGTELGLSGSSAYGQSSIPSTVATHTVYLIVTDATPTAALRLYSNDTGGSIKITNITVQELDPNGYWNINTPPWTLEEGKAVSDGTNSGSINQSGVTTLGKTYVAKYDILSYTSGSGYQQRVGSGSVYSDAETSISTHSTTQIATGNDYIYINPQNTIGSITNVSVKLLGTYSDQSIYVTAADVQTIAQASVYYLVELTSMGSKNSLYFLPSSVVPNNGRYTKLNFTVISKDALPTPASGIISFYDSVGGFDTYPMGFYEFRIYEQTSSTNLDPLLATGLLEKGFAFVRDFSGNMQELTDGFKEYNPTLTQYVYSK